LNDVSNPRDDHWNALDRVMRYLKGTASYGIHYTGYLRVLEGYSDSNWISDSDGHKWICVYTWRWRCFLEVLQAEHLNKVNNGSKTHNIRHSHCDNQTAIIKVNSSKDNVKSSRHVKRGLKSVRKMGNSRVIALDYIQTSKNLADPFTKDLSRNVIENASKEM
jgi:hypothetical protein